MKTFSVVSEFPIPFEVFCILLFGEEADVEKIQHPPHLYSGAQLFEKLFTAIGSQIDFNEKTQDEVNFELFFHLSLGRTSVHISNWMNNDDDAHQRLCFYGMSESEGMEETTCLETQTKLETRHTDGELSELQVKKFVVPQNSQVGAVFRISMIWKVTPPDAASMYSRVHIDGQVECTQKIWGVQGMVEQLLLDKAKENNQTWIQYAHKVVEVYKNSDFGSAYLKKFRLEKNLKHHSSLKDSNRQFSIVDRQSSWYKVVSGTEKIVALLNNPTKILETLNPPVKLVDEELGLPTSPVDSDQDTSCLNCLTGLKKLHAEKIIFMVIAISFVAVTCLFYYYNF